MPGTHSYVGQLPCGCGVSFVADWPEYAAHTAKDVADMIKRGLVVQRLENGAPATAAFRAKCANYPHEDWQRRLEDALEKKRQEV